MATRKQRRRRAKTFRHESTFVVYDDDGNEVEVDPSTLRPKRDEKTSAKASGAKGGSAGGKAVREVDPATWQRALKKAALSSVVLAALLAITQKGSPGGLILIGVGYGLALTPLWYFVDRTAYRSYLKRSGKS